MNMDTWILDEAGFPLAEPDMTKWGKWFGENNRRVSETKISEEVTVLTTFLGVDHGPAEGSPYPVLWESMVFGGKLNGMCRRCAGTLRDAQLMHVDFAEYVKRAE